MQNSMVSSAKSFLVLLSGSIALTPSCSDGPQRDLGSLLEDLAPQPDSPTYDEPLDCPATLPTVDDVHAMVLADILSEDASARPFLRYASFVNHARAGTCGSALELERTALSKLLNSTSTSAELTSPVSIDSERLVYRLDLRDYGWTRPVTVDGQSFDNGWDALIDVNPLAIEYRGSDATVIKSQAGTLIPIVPANSLVHYASRDSLYAALANIPPTKAELLAELQIDVEENVRTRSAVMAGTTRSIVARHNRRIERHSIGSRDGALWLTAELNERQNRLFTDPLTATGGESMAIYPLPNGLLAFAIFDAEGDLAVTSDFLFDTIQNDFRARSGVSCMGCHSTGLLPVVDEVRANIEPDSEFFEDVNAMYIDDSSLADLIADDGDGYRAALSQLQIDSEGQDSVSSSSSRYDLDLTAFDMAAELMVSLARLEADRETLEPLLIGSTMDRRDFEAYYLSSLCTVQAESQNRPANCP